MTVADAQHSTQSPLLKLWINILSRNQALDTDGRASRVERGHESSKGPNYRKTAPGTAARDLSVLRWAREWDWLAPRIKRVKRVRLLPFLQFYVSKGGAGLWGTGMVSSGPQPTSLALRIAAGLQTMG